MQVIGQSLLVITTLIAAAFVIHQSWVLVMWLHLALLVVIQRAQPEGDIRDISPGVEVVEGEYGPRAPVVILQRLKPLVPAAAETQSPGSLPFCQPCLAR